MAKVECDENHIYRVDGVIKPGFSEILEAVGFKKNPHWTEAARAEGVALHSWLIFLATGQKPQKSPDPRIAGRVDGIRKFLSDRNFKFIGGETPLYHPMFGYCVTPDIYGALDDIPTVIEAKRGAPLKRHRLQTAAQALALESGDGNFWYKCALWHRCALYLEDGGYTLDQHGDNEDFECWKAILAGYFAGRQYAD